MLDTDEDEDCEVDLLVCFVEGDVWRVVVVREIPVAGVVSDFKPFECV